MNKEYTLRDAFIDFIVQYGELSRELQKYRLQYGEVIHAFRSKDDLINEQMHTIKMMNDRYENDQKFINLLIEKLCIRGNYSREYLESLYEEIKNADRDGESEQREEMETPPVQQRPMSDDREDSAFRVQQEER